MTAIVLNLVVPWVVMLPFVLVVIAAIEMIKEWLPSRLPDDGPPTALLPAIGVLDSSTLLYGRDYAPHPRACRAEPTRLDYSTERP